MATIESAKFGVREAEVAVDNTRIVAPFDGTVLKKNADVGEIVAPLGRGGQFQSGGGDHRRHVIARSRRRCVRSEHHARVSAEQHCEITLDAYPQQRYPGYVSNIVPTADRAKATVMVKIKFKEYDQRCCRRWAPKLLFSPPAPRPIRPNVKPLLTVPAAAVATRDGRQVVYQISDEHAVEVPVTDGRKARRFRWRSTSGLKEGDKVIGKVDEQHQETASKSSSAR